MRKRNIILIVLPVLLLCLGLMQKHRNSAPVDSNFEYLSNAQVPNRCIIYYSPFEPSADIWETQQAPDNARHLTDPKALKRVVDDALSRMGEMIAPYQGCESCSAYTLLMEKGPENPSSIRLYFLVENGEFLPVAYAQFTGYINHVWYAFDDPEEFVETYWNLAVPSE